MNSLAERSQIASIPVFYIQHANTSLLIKDTEGWLIHPNISPQESDMIIHKTQGNAFLDTTLHKELDKQGVKDLIITGLVTQGCIRATCLGGLELGYRVFLVEDGHSNFNKDAGSVIRKNQTKLEQAGVDIISTKNLAFA
ncbi:MAG: cysteine hydrolase [Anaerolineales bacterium]|nr:cysteine hydrolase [Anaerolineales bacterium]